MLEGEFTSGFRSTFGTCTSTITQGGAATKGQGFRDIDELFILKVPGPLFLVLHREHLFVPAQFAFGRPKAN
jgi:hypothetical protein